MDAQISTVLTVPVLWITVAAGCRVQMKVSFRRCVDFGFVVQSKFSTPFQYADRSRKVNLKT